MTLVDSNVLIDFFGRDPKWWDWSLACLGDAILRGPVFINDVIYAETSIRFQSFEDFEHRLTEAGITMTSVPREAVFNAGKAFVRYRRAGGSRTGVLPDFFIGAHAAVTGLTLLTRDPRRYRTYFPTIQLIAPESTA